MAVVLLLIFLTGLVLSEEPPDVDCWVVNLDYVHCQWKPSASPDVHYTFYSRYVQNATHLGCDHPYEDLWMKRFSPYVTKLVLGNQSFPEQTHHLKAKVRLNAPFNLTVKIGPDSKLWWYWNQTHEHGCIESEVRHRINGNKWEFTQLTNKSYCIDLPRRKRYELQVKIRVKDACVKSDWSDWCPPVFWGPTEETNRTGTNGPSSSMGVWTPVLCALGAFIFSLLVIILLQLERIKIILIPIIPNPDQNMKLTHILADGNLEDWLPISKGIKEGLKVNYSESACCVREYSLIPASASETADPSVATDESDRSVSVPVKEPAGPASCSRTAATIPI
ncbi:Cytokine receptor common subunit gamma [Merluccius polli]|uniref:Cytokine receptor common subunit gamma n=1 Tax=Merluccius polli TaxID=89951 RepID=A0AA47NAS2_MERPO|nr:Cytokine receptor common subunit gamma [Merluccius polli]